MTQLDSPAHSQLAEDALLRKPLPPSLFCVYGVFYTLASISTWQTLSM